MQKDLISLKEASTKLGVSYDFLLRFIKFNTTYKGIIKLGRVWRIDYPTFKLNFINENLDYANFKQLSAFFYKKAAT